MKTEIPSGIYPTMITPYTEDNKIDFDAVEQILWWYNGKVDGVFAACQSSEIFYLSHEEKLELINFIMAHKPKDMTIVASGHTEDDLDTQIKQAAAYMESGMDAYVFISNRFVNPEDSDELLVERMLNAVDKLPECLFGVYECPHPYKRELSPFVMKSLADSGKFCFVKDTCCDLDKIAAKLDAVKGTNLKIYNANASTFLSSIQLGCEGFSGIMANFYPEIFREIFRCFKTDPERAKKLQALAGFCSLAEGQRYSCNAKYFLQLEGLKLTTLSRSTNVANFSAEDKRLVEQLHDMVVNFKADMGIK